MANVFHKDHGFVITTDQYQINELLAKGGELVDKCSAYGKELESVIEEVKPETEKRWKRK